MDEWTTFAEYLKLMREKVVKISLKEVEQRSTRAGFKVSNGYVSQLENGQATNPSVDAIMGLAKAFGVSPIEVFNAARGHHAPNEEVEHTQIIEDYSDIPPQCQKDVRDLLKVLRQNHSVSERKEKKEERRKEVAATTLGPPNDEADARKKRAA